MEILLSLVQKLTLPNKQRPRRVAEKVEKLKVAGVIKEVFFPKWLANTMVVMKKYDS